jgi:hypothetical protein
MSDQPRDWDRELADIDRLMAKQGGAPAGGAAPVPAPPRASVPAGVAPVRRRSVALTWFWVGLALALGVALAIWPYQRACGLQLFFFLGAAAITGLVGLLGALASWSHRRGFAHIVSLLVVLWSAVVALRETLPRVGYAKASRTWTCQVAPAGTARPPVAPAPVQPSAGQSSPVQPSAGPPSPAQPSPAQPSPAPAGQPSAAEPSAAKP